MRDPCIYALAMHVLATYRDGPREGMPGRSVAGLAHCSMRLVPLANHRAQSRQTWGHGTTYISNMHPKSVGMAAGR